LGEDELASTFRFHSPVSMHKQRIHDVGDLYLE